MFKYFLRITNYQFMAYYDTNTLNINFNKHKLNYFQCNTHIGIVNDMCNVIAIAIFKW
jgi:hypothetical protein